MADAPSTTNAALPFERYRAGGRQLLGIPGPGDVTARHGYGPPVFRECGFACAYCDLDMGASYEAWLQISVDHVIPRSTLAAVYPREWVEDLANLVTCCRSCNEFTNAYVVHDAVPSSAAEFLALRDRHFLAKRTLALASHERERSWHAANGLVRAETVPQLMARYGALLRELRGRDVTRTDNNPVSDYAEALVARALSLERGHGATRGYDGIDGSGVRYQVKARRLSPVELEPAARLRAGVPKEGPPRISCLAVHGRCGPSRCGSGIRSGSVGQSVVEFAFVLPLLLFLVLAIADFGRIYTSSIAVESAAREAADFGSFHASFWDPANRAVTVAEMERRACVAAAGSHLEGYAEPEGTVGHATCANPVFSYALEPDDPSCSNALTEPPCVVHVWIDYDFKMILSFPPLPGTLHIRRDIRFRMADLTPP